MSKCLEIYTHLDGCGSDWWWQILPLCYVCGNSVHLLPWKPLVMHNCVAHVCMHVHVQLQRKKSKNTTITVSPIRKVQLSCSTRCSACIPPLSEATFVCYGITRFD